MSTLPFQGQRWVQLILETKSPLAAEAITSEKQRIAVMFFVFVICCD
jgi:hypothetical protein